VLLRASMQGRKLGYELTPRAVVLPLARIPPTRSRAEAWDLRPSIETRGASLRVAPKGRGMPLVRDPGTASPKTEITVVGGGSYRVEGDPKDVERRILDAARGSIMEIAWFVEAGTGERIGINPECVVALRAINS
jgi:hypothetical protein